MKQIRKRLSQDEADLIENYRRIKQEADSKGIDVKDVKHGWLKSGESSLFFKNPDFKDKKLQEIEKLKDELKREFAEYAPYYPKIKRTKSKDGHLLVISPADVHIGKLCTSFETGEDYNQQIAVKRVKEGVPGILIKFLRQPWL